MGVERKKWCEGEGGPKSKKIKLTPDVGSDKNLTAPTHHLKVIHVRIVFLFQGTLRDPTSGGLFLICAISSPMARLC